MLVAGIWIFGFDDEIFGTKTVNQNSIPQPTQQKQIVSDDVMIETKPSETPQTKPDAEMTEKPNDPEQKLTIKHTTNKGSNLMKSLENSEFELDVHGTAYEGSRSLSKAAEITLKMIPVKDTNLEKFDVSDGKLIIGITGISFDKGTAEIKGTTISISVTNDDSLDPFFTIIGTLDEPVRADKDTKQKVTFADQLIYFGKKDEATPHHFDADGELKHTSV
ncbi:hypothetical protein SU86_005355 [Candidatus Nitrosotenuis cloacae]|uniref:Uncharacterized protein n=2 Tax=Candidatus Nitrosotenuis cloacae TaxID=1603555 RepID=A0A3G1B2S8_9ARCH|nr:hypothetical protein SU86_005355 [Candidatus Nitrosotenuis cloacae]